MAILTGNVRNGFFQPRYKVDFGYSPIPATLYDSAQLKITQSNQGLTVAQRSGAVQITAGRTAGYAMTSWDGNADTALKVQALNYAANSSARGGLLGLYVYVRQYSGGNICNLYGAQISVDDRGSGSPASANAVSLTVQMRINGANTASNVAIFEHNSQGTITATTCTGTAMVKIRSTQPIASGARLSGIHFETSGSGSGWTNAFSFQTAAGKEGFTAIADGDLKGKVNGYIKVYDVATGQTLYINCYDTVPS